MENISTFLDAAVVNYYYADGHGRGADSGYASSYDSGYYSGESAEGHGYGYGRGAGTGSDDNDCSHGYGSGYAYGEGYDNCNGGDEGYDIDDKINDDIDNNYCI